MQKVCPSGTLLGYYTYLCGLRLSCLFARVILGPQSQNKMRWMPTLSLYGWQYIESSPFGHREEQTIYSMKNGICFFLALFLALVFSSCSSSEDVVPSITVPTGNENYFGKNIDFDSSPSQKTVTFNTNMDWNISVPDNIDWCQVSPQKGSAGTQNVTISVSKNETYDDRSAVLRFSVGDSTKTIIVNQKQQDALTLTADMFEVPQTGGTVDVEVKSNIDFTYVIPAAYQSWIHASAGARGSRALTSHHLSFTVDASDEYSKREGSIIIKSSNKEEVITIYQAGGGLLTLSSNEISIGEKGGTAEIIVNSNFDFGFEMPHVDWIKVDDTVNSRAMSSHVIKLIISENMSPDVREASIEIYDRISPLSETVKIIQEKASFGFASSNIEMMEGEKRQLEYVNNLRDKAVTFISSNPEVATVGENGEVTAITRGEAIVTMTSADGKNTAQCKVVVKNILDGKVLCYCSGGMIFSNGSLITYGSRLNWVLLNNSSSSMTLKSLQLIDGVTGKKGNEMAIDKVVAPGESVGYGTTVGLAGINAPVTCRFKIEYNGKIYIQDAVYKQDN